MIVYHETRVRISLRGKRPEAESVRDTEGAPPQVVRCEVRRKFYAL